MTRADLAGYRIFKSDDRQRVRGAMLTHDTVRGEVGDKLIDAILAVRGEEKVYEIDGRYYAVFAPRAETAPSN